MSVFQRPPRVIKVRDLFTPEALENARVYCDQLPAGGEIGDWLTHLDTLPQPLQLIKAWVFPEDPSDDDGEFGPGSYLMLEFAGPRYLTGESVFGDEIQLKCQGGLEFLSYLGPHVILWENQAQGGPTLIIFENGGDAWSWLNPGHMTGIFSRGFGKTESPPAPTHHLTPSMSCPQPWITISTPANTSGVPGAAPAAPGGLRGKSSASSTTMPRSAAGGAGRSGLTPAICSTAFTGRVRWAGANNKPGLRRALWWADFRRACVAALACLVTIACLSAGGLLLVSEDGNLRLCAVLLITAAGTLLTTVMDRINHD
jgi:hypothetical protein